jgi:hypothetical protein
VEPHAVLRDLLQGVERLLAERGRHAEAALAARLAVVLSQYPDPQAGLDSLYSVHGMQDLALRLMWSVRQTSADQGDAHLEQERFEDQVVSVAREVEQLSAAAERLRREQPGYLDLTDALKRLGTVLGEMNRAATETPFQGFAVDLLDRAGEEASTVSEAAASEGKSDIVGFAQGVQRFCRFVVERRLMFDLRCARLMGNAHFALQAALDTNGADAFDALRQTTHLLNNPETVFV